MKVLNVVGSLDQRSGGPLRVVLNLSAMSAPLGLHSEILGFGPISIPDDPPAAELIQSLPLTRPISYGYSPDLRQWCKDNLRRFDVVILHGLWTYFNWALSRECIKERIPYIVMPHGMLDLWSIYGQGILKRIKKKVYWHWRERKVIAGCNSVFFTTRRELHNAILAITLPPCVKQVVNPYGISPRDSIVPFEPSAKVDQGKQLRVALFLGRIHPKKRLDLLIEAWRDAKLGPEWKLVIAGDGDTTYLSNLMKLVNKLRLGDAVQFVGAVSGTDKQYLFQRASWFLLPSEQENFGVAAIEAVQAGCALAISDQVYLSDELPEGSEVLPVQMEAWSEFMRARMPDEDWRAAQVRRASDALLPKFDRDKVAKGWRDAIESSIMQRSAAVADATAV
jgi:glycosyltransferase involved in cell wall biosynthesis